MADGPSTASGSSTASRPGKSWPATTCSGWRARSCCSGSGVPRKRAQEYERALGLTANDSEKRHIQKRLAELASGS